jgi:hypothetical protein
LAHIFANAPTLSANTTVWQHRDDVGYRNCCRKLRGLSSWPRRISEQTCALVSRERFKICSYELGDRSLTSVEQLRITEALRAEAERLRNLSTQIDFGHTGPTAAQEASGD